MFIILPQINFSQTVGPNSPLATGNQPLDYCTICTGSIWDNTNNIAIADGQYSDVQLANIMFCYHDSCYRSRYLTCNNFNFSIPTNAIITGVEVRIKGFSDVNMAVLDGEIQLTQGIVLVGNNMASPVYWSNNDSIRYYGNSSCLWGLNLSTEDINNSGFGVYIKVYNSTLQTPSVFVDEVSITVSYAIGTEVISQTQSPNPIYVSNNYLTGNLDVLFKMPQGSNGANLKMYDIKGRECFSSMLKSMSGEISELQINTDALNSGIYLIKIITEDKIYEVKTLLAK